MVRITTDAFSDAILLNNFVWDGIFMHSTDPAQFAIGLKWMEGVLRRNPTVPNHIDTYANLLYKAGHKLQAIQWEEKALTMAKEAKEDYGYIDNIGKNLERMKRNEPTWEINTSNQN